LNGARARGARMVTSSAYFRGGPCRSAAESRSWESGSGRGTSSRRAVGVEGSTLVPSLLSHASDRTSRIREPIAVRIRVALGEPSWLLGASRGSGTVDRSRSQVAREWSRKSRWPRGMRRLLRRNLLSVRSIAIGFPWSGARRSCTGSCPRGTAASRSGSRST